MSVFFPASALPAEVVAGAAVMEPERTPVSMVVPATSVSVEWLPDRTVVPEALLVLAATAAVVDATAAVVDEAAVEVAAAASVPKPGRKVGEYEAVPL